MTFKKKEVEVSPCSGGVRSDREHGLKRKRYTLLRIGRCT